MNEYTKAGLYQYLDVGLEKGFLQRNTGNSWRAAANKLLGDLQDGDDVERFDVHDAALRYNNRFPNELTGASLKKYVQRLRQAIAQYVAWKSDPMNYKGPSRGLPNSKVMTARPMVLRRTRPAIAVQNTSVAPEVGHLAIAGHPPTVHVGPNPVAGIVIPFPLRVDFVAQFHIPRDLSTDEAKRLSVFIQALGHDMPTKETRE